MHGAGSSRVPGEKGDHAVPRRRHEGAAADGFGRLRASGLDPPARRADERDSSGACAATSAGFTPYGRASHRQEPGGGDDRIDRVEGRSLGRREGSAHDRVRRAVLGLMGVVGTVGSMAVPMASARGHRRRNGGHGHRSVRLLGRPVNDGAQHQHHHQGGAGRRDESTPPGRPAGDPCRLCGHSGMCRHKSSALLSRLRHGRSETQTWVGAGRHRRM